MLLFFTFIIAILATYGVSKIVTAYDGPYEVFYKLRDKYPLSPFLCLVCTAVWVAVPICIFSGLSVIDYMAVIGAVILMEVKL